MTNVDSKLNDYMPAWGARSVPFHDEEKQQLFETEHTRQAVERLQQSAALRSVMLLSGDNGVGKSALVASWVRSLEPKAYRPLTITQASLSASGVLCALLAKLGQVPGYQRAVNISRMEDAIGHLGSVIPVIILDEAQNYTASAMEEVRLLLGLNLPSQPVFCLIMIGDNYLLDSLRLQSRRALYTRIAVSHQIQPLQPAQVEAYLIHRLKQAGLDRPCFEDAAVEMIASASDGVPRTINLISRTAWIEASREQQSKITPKHVDVALRLVPVARDKIAVPAAI
ncbi:MAG: AAA family ATPase [Verrucomicrobia bacterium]|nr:AAA family ATPase [Verrucomicrobiota bacterium]